MRIINIVVHHFGGLGTDNYASTRHLTPQNISKYHKNKWNFPSKYIEDTDIKYMGYNAIYDVNTRKFYQGRAVGEETAAQRGHNSDSFSLAVSGNLNRSPVGSPRKPVDPLGDGHMEDITKYLHDLLNGNKRKLVVAANTQMQFKESRIYAHRFFSSTQCYGTYFSNNHFRDLVMSFKPAVLNEDGTTLSLRERRRLERQLKRLVAALWDLVRRIRATREALGAPDDRDDGDNIDPEYL